MTIRRRITASPAAGLLAAGLLAASCLAVSSAQDQPTEDLANYPRARLQIHSSSGTHSFAVWIADTPARQEQGLMFVRQLGADRGMVFPNCCSGIWMKNCYIELDIVFVGARDAADERRRDSTTGGAATGGVISKIAPRAKPHDETPIPAGGPVSAVVELAGGTAATLQLKPGDRVSWEPLK